jgi:hypothetical protein
MQPIDVSLGQSLVTHTGKTSPSAATKFAVGFLFILFSAAIMLPYLAFLVIYGAAALAVNGVRAAASEMAKAITYAGEAVVGR